MGKYSGDSLLLKVTKHPVLNQEMLVPTDYEFFKKAECGKLEHAQKWLRQFRNLGEGNTILEAYAGCGILSMIYLDAGATTLAIEQKPGLVRALRRNIKKYTTVSNGSCICADNMAILPGLQSNDASIKAVDLDCYSQCSEQIHEAARILQKGLLFVSSGEILTICRFKRKDFAERRYGRKLQGTWRDFPVELVYPYIRDIFRERGKKTELVDVFVWPSICRLCIKVA